MHLRSGEESWKAIITLNYITHEIMLLEAHGFQHDVSAHGEMGESHLKTCRKKTAIGGMRKLVGCMAQPAASALSHLEQELCLGAGLIW